MNEPSTISLPFDRVLMIMIASLVAFMTFKDTINASQQANSSELARLTAEVSNLSKVVAELKEFAAKPRFTHDDHNLAMTGVNAVLARHEAALTERGNWMRARDAAEQRTSFKLERIEERLNALEQDRQ